jgi:type IV pilus assembly protein PilB
MARGFGEFLVTKHLVTAEQLQQAYGVQEESHLPLPRALVALGCLTESQMLQAAAAYVGYPCVDLSGYEVNLPALFVVPCHIVERYQVLPLWKRHRLLIMATCDPFNVIGEEAVRLFTSPLEVQWVVALTEQIEAGITNAKEATKDCYL